LPACASFCGRRASYLLSCHTLAHECSQLNAYVKAKNIYQFLSCATREKHEQAAVLVVVKVSRATHPATPYHPPTPPDFCPQRDMYRREVGKPISKNSAMDESNSGVKNTPADAHQKLGTWSLYIQETKQNSTAFVCVLNLGNMQCER